MTGAILGGTPMAELGEASTPTDPAQRRPVTAICGGSIANPGRHRRHRGRLAACEELSHRSCPKHPDRWSRGRRQDLAGRGGVSRDRGHQPPRAGRGRHHRHRLRARGDPQAHLGLPGRGARRARRLQGQPAGRPRLRRLHRRRALGPAGRRRGAVRGLGGRGGRDPDRGRLDHGRGAGPAPGLLHQQARPRPGLVLPLAWTPSRPPSARPARPCTCPSARSRTSAGWSGCCRAGPSPTTAASGPRATSPTT